MHYTIRTTKPNPQCSKISRVIVVKRIVWAQHAPCPTAPFGPFVPKGLNNITRSLQMPTPMDPGGWKVGTRTWSEYLRARKTSGHAGLSEAEIYANDEPRVLDIRLGSNVSMGWMGFFFRFLELCCFGVGIVRGGCERMSGMVLARRMCRINLRFRSNNRLSFYLLKYCVRWESF